jgi:hypothetical protein
MRPAGQFVHDGAFDAGDNNSGNCFSSNALLPMPRAGQGAGGAASGNRAVRSKATGTRTVDGGGPGLD